MTRRTLLAAVMAVISLFAVACGDDDADPVATGDPAAEDASETGDTEEEPTEDSGEGAGADESGEAAEDPAEEAASGGFPVTIESDAGTFTLDAAPQRIVSLSPAVTEILFAIGAGDQVVAVDEFSTYPPEAPITDLSGFDPNVEAVIGYDPDLVIVSFDANDLVAGLTGVGIPVLMSYAPVDIESGYDTIAELGIAVGRVDETAAVVAEMRTAMDEALAGAPGVPVRVYHELDDTYFSASSSGFVGAIYTALGAENIADAADPDGTGFPQLTEEYIVEADPELIVITDEIGYSASDVAARPGWAEITAVAQGDIVSVDADVASRWGPRLPQLVTALAEAMSGVVAAAS